MTETILTRIRTGYAFLSRVEKEIADVILRDPAAFTTCSMQQLAQEIGVSQGSIHNFSQKFAGGGFSALKLQVAGCLFAHREGDEESREAATDTKTIMERKIRGYSAAFFNTLEINGDDKLEQAVERILSAKRVEIYGVFYSAIAARDFSNQLIQLGIPAMFVSDMLMCAVSASMLDSDSLVVAVTSSGRTKEIVDAVKQAKQNHVPVIGLTCDRTSPLAKLSDLLLLSASSGTSIQDKMDEVRLSQMLVLDTLSACIRNRIEAEDREHYARQREIVSSHNIED